MSHWWARVVAGWWVTTSLFVLVAAAASVVFVAPTGTDQSSCGLTVQTACGSLLYAVSTISSATLNTIEVAEGVYTETGNEVEFSATGITHDLTIQAAASATTPPTIDRGYKGRLFTFATGAGKITIDGLKFYRGGWNDETLSVDFVGGVMRFLSSDGTDSVIFNNCVFEANRNPAKGYAGRGGVGAIAAGSPAFSHCTFINNWGGIASAFYINGQATPVFEYCTFQDSGCFHDGWGGVVVPEGSSAAVWRHCVFRNNTCDYGGAGDDGGTATPVFEDCLFEQNFGRGLGGAYYGFGDAHSTFRRCTFLRNRVPKGGNGQDFYLSSSSHATFEDCMFDSGEDAMVAADGASGDVKDNSTLTMRRSVVQRYKAYQGVVLVSVDARAEIESTVFMDNSCVRGGALHIERPIEITNCTFLRNTATEAGAILLNTKLPISATITDSTFKDNVAKNNGGAIRITGPFSVAIVNTRFTHNTAQGVGGGSIYMNGDVELTVNSSTFIANTANMGGAIWSEGTLAVYDSGFFENELLTSDSDGNSDSCGLAAGTGGAIYAALPGVLDTQADAKCTIGKHLQLRSNVMESNSAGPGGGGAIFVDKGIPTCVNTIEAICGDCTFTNNIGAYGADVATIVSSLFFNTSPPTSWELMSPSDVVIGGKDQLNQTLTGSHTPIVVRVAVGYADVNRTDKLLVSLSSNASHVLRSGSSTFKSLALQLPVTSMNNIDVPLTLSFSSDLASIGRVGPPLMLTALTTLLKCKNDNGVIRADGKCLIEASGNSNQLIAAIVFAVVLGGGFAFVFYWSYKHSSRVLETLHRLVTGVGASVIRLAFELLDVISDVQAMVNLFLFDVNLSNLVLARAIYVTLFVISLPPSIAVMKATLENVVFQWKRLHTRRAVAHHDANDVKPVKQKDTGNDDIKPFAENDADEDESKPKTDGTTGKEKTTTASLARSIKKRASFRSVVEERQQSMMHVIPVAPTIAARDAPIRWDVLAVQEHLVRQIAMLERDLEYHQARAKYMQRVLVRLLTEDILLFIFNLYIYLVNQSNTVFLQSRFRSSLEFSILMSAMHFGAQVQNMVAWLHANKVGEIKRQLDTIRALQRS